MSEQKLHEHVTGNIILYPHQIKALTRMPVMETEGKGGVLAFCPGLGKTITMASHLKHMKEFEKTIGKNGCDIIVCPVAVISHWEKEILSIHTESKPNILIYHGSKRDRKKLKKKKIDYIITTYSILKRTIDGEYEINKKRFVRIVLDEAHIIKNGSQKKCPAIAMAAFDFAKRSKFKWCITGTPFNNSIMDLASLAMFIGNKKYKNPEDWKKDYIDVNEWRKKNVLLMKKDGLLKKPICHDNIITPTKEESDLMESLRDIAGKQYEKWLEATGIDRIKEQGTLIALLTKMRQCSDSCYVIDEEYKSMSPNDLYNRSSKVKKTVTIIGEKLYGEDPDPCKSIVIFSQFTRYLKLLQKVIEHRLPEVDIYIYTGSTPKDDRDYIINEFTRDKRPRVLLISLFSGGVGLNLNPCSNILLSEPWYNPFVEQQAQDRVHRLGQKYQVHVFRLTMDNSVEKWMQGIKMRKLIKAADIGLIDNVPKKGMGGISSTFNMDDLASLFNDYVGLKKHGKLINPKSSSNDSDNYKKSKELDGDMTEESFCDIMNNCFGDHMWKIIKNLKTNNDYDGGKCIEATMPLNIFYDFAADCDMTYINKLRRKKNANNFGVYIQILPGRLKNVQIWYTVHDGNDREIRARLKNKNWCKINKYLKVK